MLAHGAGARQSSVLPPARPPTPSHSVRRRPSRASTRSPSRPDQDDADRDRARMQADRAIAERELRLQERHDIALQVDGIEVEAGEEPAVPGGRAAQGDGGGRNSGCLRAHWCACEAIVAFSRWRCMAMSAPSCQRCIADRALPGELASAVSNVSLRREARGFALRRDDDGSATTAELRGASYRRDSSALWVYNNADLNLSQQCSRRDRAGEQRLVLGYRQRDRPIHHSQS